MKQQLNEMTTRHCSDEALGVTPPLVEADAADDPEVAAAAAASSLAEVASEMAVRPRGSIDRTA